MIPVFSSGGIPPVRTVRLRVISGWAPFLALVVLAAWGARSDAGQEKAPRHPPEPFRVFVHTSDPADAALKAKLEEAVPMVRERVERRRKWFRLAESPEAAQITLRIVNYRAEQHWILRRTLPWGTPGDPGQRGREYHFLDAIVQGGDVRTTLSGLDERPVGIGPALRNAASHLAEELERFCKDNYGALEQLRATAGPRERRNGGASAPAKNASPQRP